MTIREHRRTSPGYYEIVFDAPFLARVSYPGQFCMVSAPGVFLKRPLSIYRAGKGKLSFLYRVVGKGTQGLSMLPAGRTVEVLGPLGTGYDLSAAKGKTPLLVAGGTGIASLTFLAERLKRPGILFYGARCKAEFVGLAAFRRLGWKLKLATDDGSAGTKGLVTDILERELESGERGDGVIYACGPYGMLKKTAVLSAAFDIPAHVSLEEMMACGIGNCQGCAVRIGETYKMVCKDGPVFDARTVNFR